MEVTISAVASELVNHFISFLRNKYSSSRPRSKEQVEERLHHILMRVRTIVEEADTRYITNSGMMMQLKTLSDAMYRGYSVVDSWRYQALQDGAGFDEVSRTNPFTISLYLAKRSRPTTDKATRLEPHGALESLETVLANMKEFIVLLGGCERMSRRPYDVYLYTDNFMFGRHAEKQRLLSFLLQHDDRPDDCAPAVLPIIGGTAVGKKTLVAHVCGDERVRSRFSSVLHLNGDDILRKLDHGRTMEGMMLVVIEFSSDVGDDDWKRFYSFVITMGRGSKILIISRLRRLARFGSVKPIFLSALSYDELRYLFKTLAFGSIDPEEHPGLGQIADEFAKVLHNIALVAANAFAEVLRRNLDAKFWRCILDKGLGMVERNISMHGMPPTMLVQQGQPVDITDFTTHPLRMTRYTANTSIKEDLPCVKFGELITDHSVRPKGDFTLITWESRIPPHNVFANFVTSHAQGTREGSNALLGRKRRGVPI
ncbi:unnamed protein product [Alopecurus aequalis]